MEDESPAYRLMIDAINALLNGPAADDLADALGVDLDDPDVEHAVSRAFWRAWISGARWGVAEAGARAAETFDAQYARMRSRYGASFPAITFTPMTLEFRDIDPDDPLGPHRTT